MGAPTVGDPHLRHFGLALRTRNRQNITKIIYKGHESEEKRENVKIVNFLHFHFTKARDLPNIVVTNP